MKIATLLAVLDVRNLLFPRDFSTCVYRAYVQTIEYSCVSWHCELYACYVYCTHQYSVYKTYHSYHGTSVRTAGCVRTIKYSPKMVSVRTGLRTYRKSNTELACDPGHTRISSTASRVYSTDQASSLFWISTNIASSGFFHGRDRASFIASCGGI